MDRRLELQAILENILGSREVYFQPPENVKIKYPCIVYTRSDIYDRYADNLRYKIRVRYSLTLIGRTPQNNIVEKLLNLDYCSYDRYYVADGLSHDTFTIYY